MQFNNNLAVHVNKNNKNNKIDLIFQEIICAMHMYHPSILIKPRFISFFSPKFKSHSEGYAR